MHDPNALPGDGQTAGQPGAGEGATSGRGATAGRETTSGREGTSDRETTSGREGTSDREATAGPEGVAADLGMSQGVGAQLAPQSRLDRILAQVPRALSSHVHIIFLGALGVFLVLLPLVGVNVSAKAELIGGNYTNVTSDLGACIAAGLTVHLVRREHRRAERFEALIHTLHLRHDALERSVESAVAAAKGAEAAVRATRGGA